MSWIPPRVWAAGDAVTQTRLNEISNNLSWLKSRGLVVATISDGTNVTKSGTSWTSIDDTNLKLTHYSYGGTLRFIFNVTVQASGTQTQYYDILMDGGTYLSSNDTTSLTNGIHEDGSYSTAIHKATLIFTIDDIVEGWHNYVLRFKNNGGTTTFIFDNVITQFSVEEL